MTFTIFELFYVTLAAGFICLVVLGHALLFSAIYKCLREDWAIGQRSNRKPPLPEGANMSPVAQWSIAICIGARDLPGRSPIRKNFSNVISVTEREGPATICGEPRCRADDQKRRP